MSRTSRFGPPKVKFTAPPGTVHQRLSGREWTVTVSDFTPDQVEWVARQLDGWAASLMLVPPPGAGATFLVDLTGSQGLRRHEKVPSGDRGNRTDGGAAGDGRITVNLRYVVSVAPDPEAAGQTVVRLTTGRGFEEYSVRGTYDDVKAAIGDTTAG